MDKREILKRVDHTLLKQTATWEQIRVLCQEGMDSQTASVCIPPFYVKPAKEYVQDKLAICTVIGFPNGNMTTAAKVFETKDAVANGADEIDMVINVGALKDKEYDFVCEDIKEVKEACGTKAILKVIIETCLLTDDEKVKACELSKEANADFVKTSTGFSTGGAVASDVKIMRDAVGKDMGVKASGGIHTAEEAQAMIDAGASRLGTSATLAIIGK